jgi:hypothetical protein
MCLCYFFFLHPTFFCPKIPRRTNAVRAYAVTMMTKTKLLLAALIATSILIPTALRADRIVQIGDKPYYTHGERYWDGDYEMVWVPGHISLGSRWIHGYYQRGEHRKHEDRNAEHHDNDRR